MALTDRKVHKNARLAHKVFRPRAIPDGVLTPVAITINAAPEKFDVSAFLYAIGGQIYYHAASTAHDLSAIHATGIAKWLGVLVTIDREGTITTHGNPNTGDQDHATEAAALASLAQGQLAGLYPAHSIAIGTITLQTVAADWDGITDAFDEADLAAANLSGFSGDRRWATFQPGHKFRIQSVRSSSRSASGISYLEVVTTNDGIDAILTDPGFEVDRRTVADATVTKLRVGAFSYVIDGVVYRKAAATAIAFSAAHVVALNQWGAVLVQINAAGTVSTKVGEVTQTTPMDYDNAA